MPATEVEMGSLRLINPVVVHITCGSTIVFYNRSTIVDYSIEQ